VPPSPDAAGAGDGDGPHLTLWQRLKYTLVRPDDDATPGAPAGDRPLDEIEDLVRRADDKERAIGLVAAPVAALLAFLIVGTLVHDDPPAGAKNHVNPSLYHSLEFVLLALSVLILVTALWRKRLFLGMALVLYGLAVFNLHYWGFGIPFVLAGAWYLVRAYRLQQELRRVEAGEGGGASGKARPPADGSRPRPNKRYTPPT
jgi:hypothetical protein